MATLYVTEFAAQGSDQNGQPVPIAMQTPVAEQTVSVSASSVASSAFNNATRMVRLHTDTICSVEFGTNPTAAATKARMAANQTEYFMVPVNQQYKVATITNS